MKQNDASAFCVFYDALGNFLGGFLFLPIAGINIRNKSNIKIFILLGDKWRLFAYNNIATEIVAILEKRKDVQMKKILKEIEKALKEELYYSALALTLTLPDICGKAEYGDIPNGERYKKWINNYAIKIFENPEELSYLKEFTAENCWELRNSILHSGNKETKFKQLYLTNDNLFSITLYKKDREYNFKLSIGVKYFCSKICKVAEIYYNENKEKFNFLNDIFIT